MNKEPKKPQDTLECEFKSRIDPCNLENTLLYTDMDNKPMAYPESAYELDEDKVLAFIKKVQQKSYEAGKQEVYDYLNREGLGKDTGFTPEFVERVMDKFKSTKK